MSVYLMRPQAADAEPFDVRLPGRDKSTVATLELYMGTVFLYNYVSGRDK
jgi:hypothetical protein